MEDLIWELVVKKLAKEASAKELSNLDNLLAQYPDIDFEVGILLEWWKADREQAKDENSKLLFMKVLKAIKQIENTHL